MGKNLETKTENFSGNGISKKQKKAIKIINQEIRNRHIGDYKSLSRLIKRAGYIIKRQKNHEIVYSQNHDIVINSEGFPIIISTHGKSLGIRDYLGVLEEIKIDFNKRYPLD